MELIKRLIGKSIVASLRRLINPFILNRIRAKLDYDFIDLEECISDRDIKALVSLAESVARPQMKIIEIGTWKGCTASHLGGVAKKYGGSVYCVDHWQGNEGTWNAEIVRSFDVFNIFRSNMMKLGLWGVVKALYMTSEEAGGIIKDNSIDLVFIDADHCYLPILQDIKLWLPKVKVGGILCGHDCEGFYREYTKQERAVIDSNLEVDIVQMDSNRPCHPGIIKALHQCFNVGYSIMPDSVVWYYQKWTKPL